MDNQALVSVVLTCYNYEKFVKTAIHSVLQQSYTNIEIIIINDGSTDRSGEMIESFLPDKRIRYVSQQNRGQAYSKNKGVELARGTFVAFIDADDVWEAPKLEKQIPLFENEKVAVVYSLVQYIDTNGSKHKKNREGLFLGPYRGRVTENLFLRNFVPFSSSVVRRRFLRQHGSFDQSLRMGIDWDLWLRLSTVCEFDYVKEKLLLYRVGHGNQMSSNFPLRHSCSDRIMEKFMLHYADSITPATVKKAQGFTYYNRARQIGEYDRRRSNTFYRKAIRYPSFTVLSLKGLAKNGFAALDRRKLISNSRGSVLLPGGNKKKQAPKKNIAFVIDTIRCDTEGTQRQLLETIRRLDKTRFDPVLICLWNSSWMSENPLPCKTVVLGFQGFLKMNVVQVMYSFRTVLRRNQIEIVQAFFEDSRFFVFFATRLLKNAPVLVGTRRDIGLDAKRPWYHGVYTHLYPFINMWYDGILTNSRQVAAFVNKAEKVRQDKIKVIYNGISFERSASEAPLVLKGGRDEIRIGVVASLTPVKRIDDFLYALTDLTKQTKSAAVRGFIVGDGSQRGYLEELCGKLHLNDHVHFTGAVRDVSAYLRHFHIGINCSEREGLSNAVLEYMACGLPVIVTNVGGNSELVNAERGIVVEPGDRVRLSQAMLRLINDSRLRGRLGENARLFVHQNFSWDGSMGELHRYYDSLMEKKRGERYLWQYQQSQH